MDYGSHNQYWSKSNQSIWYRILSLLLVLTTTIPAHAANPSPTELSVWTNEAIVDVYTFGATDFIERQKEIADYFTTEGWIGFNKALATAKLHESIKKNNYDVSAVALLPPEIKTLNDKEWQATMPLLVLFKNKSYQQKQTLEVVIIFTRAKKEEGVRGLAIKTFISTIATPACRCNSQPAATNTIV